MYHREPKGNQNGTKIDPKTRSKFKSEKVASWDRLGSILGRFGGSEGLLGDLLEVLGGSWVVLRASESVLKPSWAVMGRQGSFWS